MAYLRFKEHGFTVISERDLCWVAGLFEGEAYFGVRRSNRDLLVQVGMTDEDVIKRAQIALGCGVIKQRTLRSGKTFHTLTISRQSEARAVMEALLPLMGDRRAERIRFCLAERAKVPGERRLWTHCKHGHELSGDNLQTVVEGTYTKRRCRACSRDRSQRYRTKVAA